MQRTTWVFLAMAVLVVAAPTPSDAEPQPTCKAMCQRFTDCKVPSYTMKCLDNCKQQRVEASEEGRAQLLIGMRASCKQIQQIASVVQSAVDQHQRSSAPTPSTRTEVTAHDGKLRDKELDDAEKQRGARAPARGPVPTRNERAPVRGGEGSTPFRDNSPRPAAGQPQASAQSPSGPAANVYVGCSSVCGRVSQCGVLSLGRCSDLCTRAAADGHRWRIDQASCSEIKMAFVTDKWMCTAQVSVGTRLGNGPWHYSTTSSTGTGNTRDEAGLEAHENCGAMLTTRLSLAESEGEVVNAGTCTVSQCVPPGTPVW